MGAGFAAVMWLALVPWSLDERPFARRSGDNFAPEIAGVGIVVAIVAMTLALSERTRAWAVTFAAGGLWCWTALWAWRAGTADVSGANFFMIPLLFFFVPSAVLVPLVVGVVRQRVGRDARIR